MKKNNYNWRRLRRRTLDIFKNKGVFWCAGDEQVDVVSLRTGDTFNVSTKQLALLADQQFWWSIHIAVLCRGADEQEYIKSTFLKAEHPYKQAALLDRHLQEHRRLVAGCNSQDIVCAGYIASPHGTELTDEQMDAVFTARQAWEFYTRREAEAARLEGHAIEEVVV